MEAEKKIGRHWREDGRTGKIFHVFAAYIIESTLYDILGPIFGTN